MSAPSEDSDAAPKQKKGKMPETLNELAAKYTIFSPQELEEKICLICDEKYVSGNKPEFALKLPACGHVFGLTCLTIWLGESKNSCPLCRHPILDIPAPEDEEGEEDDRAEYIGLSLVVVTWQEEEIHEEVREAALALFDETDPYMHLELQLLALGSEMYLRFADAPNIMLAQLYQVDIAQYHDQMSIGPGVNPEFNHAGGQLAQQIVLTKRKDFFHDDVEDPEAGPIAKALAILNYMIEFFLDARDRLMAAFAALPNPDEANRAIYDFILEFRGLEVQFQAAVADIREPRDPHSQSEPICTLFRQVWMHIEAPGLREILLGHHPFGNPGRGVELLAQN